MEDLKDEVRSNGATSRPGVDMKLEIVVIPVSDAGRAKEFYGRLGWRLDADVVSGGPPCQGFSERTNELGLNDKAEIVESESVGAMP